MDEQQLAGWTQTSSPTEKEKQERTERMVSDAIAAHPAFDDCDIRIYAKGSYANDTNVRVDSDVDIAVECTEVFYHDTLSGCPEPATTPYNGVWTPDRFRSELVAALRAKFGTQVDATGSTAIAVNSSSARMDADVVPCFPYRMYSIQNRYVEGTKIFKRTGGTIVNYPAQHLTAGRQKDRNSIGRYKPAVRALKRVENQLVAAGKCKATPSFLVESLVWNCSDLTLILNNTWTARIRELLREMWAYLDAPEPSVENDRWTEANGIKFLFHPHQPWTRDDAKTFVLAAWNYMGYAS